MSNLLSLSRKRGGCLGWQLYCILFVAAFWAGGTGAKAQDTSTNSSPPPVSYPLVQTNQAPPVLPVLTNSPAAQPGPEPATGTPGQPPGERLGGTSQLAAGGGVPAGALPPSSNPLEWGPFHLFPHLLYQLTYGNTLQATPGHEVNSFMNALSPGVLIQMGSHWTLDYTPTVRFYSSRELQDGTDHLVLLNGATAYNDWTLGLIQSYASTLQPLIETAAQTSQEVYATSLNASHPLGTKFSVDLGMNQNFLYLDQPVLFQEMTDHQTWSTLDWLNYHLTPRFAIGVGAGFTYDHLAFGPDMMSEQGQGRVIWSIGNKLSLVLSGGVNDMQFVDVRTPDLVSPVFSLSAQYQPFEFTTLSVGASRVVSPSYFQGQVVENTGVNAGVHQRLLGRLYLDVNGGYASSIYHASAIGPFVAQVSNYDVASLNVALNTTFLTRATASIFFAQNYITSSSGGAAYNYTTTQTGLTLGYRF